jgi:foldase protein PrsA
MPFAPEPQAADRNRGGASRLLVTIVAIACFAVGSVAGAYFKSRRDKANNTVVSINGELIMKDGFMHRMETQIGEQTLRTMIQEQLQMQFARKQGVDVTDDEVKARLAHIEQNPTLLATLNQRGETQKDLIINITVHLAQRKTLAKGVTVTDAEVRDYYRRQSDPVNAAADFYHPGTADIQAIITRSQDKIREANLSLQRGVLFETVAQRFSEDPSGKQGGRFPRIVLGRTALSKIPGFDATLTKIPVGSVYGPVQLAGTWWLIQCNERTPATTDSFDKVRSECELEARAEKGLRTQGATVEKEFEDFAHHSEVTAFWPQYRDIAH